MTSPKVSVLTPLYNTKPAELRAMIESILGQTFRDWEFLILNDSPENQDLRNIVAEYNDPRIKYIENPSNLGIAKSRNRLIDLACGEYLAVVDHDDISLPERFAKQVKYLDENPHVGVVGGNMYEVKNGKIFSQTKFPINDNDIKLSIVNMPYVCVPCHPTAMIRACVLRDNNIRYDEKWTPAEDHSLWLDLMEHTCFHNLDDVVIKYVWHGDNTTTRTWQKMYDILPIMINQARNRFPVYYDQWKTKTPPPHKTDIVIKFLGFIPLIKIKQRGGDKKVYLFNKIVLAKIKKSII